MSSASINNPKSPYLYSHRYPPEGNGEERGTPKFLKRLVGRAKSEADGTETKRERKLRRKNNNGLYLYAFDMHSRPTH